MIKRYHVQFDETYDVIVAGSGPSGVAAAVMAGRMGAKTLLIEAQGSVGGISTSGMMSHFAGRIGCNLFDELLIRAKEKNPYDTGVPNYVIDPELLRLTYYEMLSQANVQILLYTLVIDTVMDGNRVAGIVTESKSGRKYFGATVLIDCTGDGDVAYHAGATFTFGRETDGKCQPMTLMFKVGGVDFDRAVFPESFESTVETPKGELQALAKKVLPSPAGHVLLYQSTLPGIVTCNMTNCIGVDGTKAEDLTKAELTCRSQVQPIIRFLREYVPGYEECFLIGVATLMGVRETRHFHGVQTIDEQDIRTAKQFPDWVVRDAYFDFDVHNLTGASLDKTGEQKQFTQKHGYTIPYGCLIPKTVDGLLLSGRNISGTHMAHSNFRAMPICFGIGAAGGVAAALAAKTNRLPRDLNAAEIQKLIK